MFSIIFVIIVSGSLYYTSFIRNALLIPFLFLLVIYFLNRPKEINKHKIMMLLFAGILTVSNIDFVTSSLLVLFSCLVCAMIVTEVINFEEFAKVYIKIILFLSVVSWFYLPLILFDIPSPLPDFISLVDKPYSNFVLFGIRHAEITTMLDNFYHVDRNSGLFWEPGAFQIFVNTAFYLSILQKQISRNRILIFLITILTIASTTGMLVFCLLSVACYSRTKRYRTRRRNRRISVLAVVLFIIFVMSTIFNNTLEKFQEGSNSNASFLARSTDCLVDTKIVLENLWQGVGYGNISVHENYAIEIMGNALYQAVGAPGSDGLLLFLSYVGIFGVVLIGRLVYPSQVRNWSKLEKGLIVIAIALMYNNENMTMYLFPWIMMFYGFSKHSRSADLANTESHSFKAVYLTSIKSG